MVITWSSPTRPTTNTAASSAETPNPHAVDTVIAISASIRANQRSVIRRCRCATPTAPPGHKKATSPKPKCVCRSRSHSLDMYFGSVSRRTRSRMKAAEANDLSDEDWLEIVSYLSSNDLLYLFFTCSRLSNLSSNASNARRSSQRTINTRCD